MKPETVEQVKRDLERVRALAMKARAWIKPFANSTADPELVKLAAALDREADRINAEAREAVRKRGL
jgi:hypothetical protein